MMKRAILTISIILTALLGLKAQFQYPIGTPTWYKKVRVDSVFWLNTVDTVHVYATLYPGALMSRTTAGDTSLYLANGQRWVRIGSASAGGGTIDSAWRSNDTLYFRYAAGGTLSVAMNYWVPLTRSINTTSPLSGGGNLSADRTLSIANAQADGENKGAATFRSDHFDDDGMGAISLDVLNGPFLPKADTAAMLNPYLRKVDTARFISFNTLLTPLLTGTPAPIQPTNTVIEGLENLQSQISYWSVGKFIENQTSTDQIASWRISGTTSIKTTDNHLTIIRNGTGSGVRGLIYFKDASGTSVGDIGLGESTSRDYMYLSNTRAGSFHTVHDTASIILRTYNTTDGARALSSWHKGKWLLTDTAFSAANLYKDTADYQLEVKNSMGLSARFWQGISADQLLAGTLSSTYKADVRGATQMRFNGNALNLRPESSATGNIWIQFNNTSDAAIGYVGFTSAANNNYSVTNLVNGSHITFVTNGGSATEKARITSTGNLLIGTTGDNGEMLRVAGAISMATATVTGNTTLTLNQSTIRVNNTGSVTITLPAASTCTGHIFFIKKVSAASNDVIISRSGSDTIDGATSKTLTLQWSSITLQSNGTTWDILSSHANATTL